MKNQNEPSVREADLNWIRKNRPRLRAIAAEEFERQGRGVLMVSLVAADNPVAGEVPPVIYFPASRVPEHEMDIRRMVEDYFPDDEMVVSLLKQGPHDLFMSAYRCVSVEKRCRQRRRKGAAAV
jgi:hypothetical protein